MLLFLLWRNLRWVSVPSEIAGLAYGRKCGNSSFLPRSKYLLGRLAYGLPTRLNLVKRGLNVEAKCTLHEKAIESASHALIYYDKLCEVWWNWQDCPINLLAKNICLVDLALKILDASTPLDLEILFAIAWSIWFNRNQVVHDSNGNLSYQIWNLVLRTQEDYKNAILYNHVKQQAPDVGWVAPPPKIYKINVDGATVGAGGRSSMGVVIRDSGGMVIVAACKVLNGDYDAVVAKAFVVDEGIQLAKEMELHQIIVESDSIGVVDSINANNCNGDIGMVIQGSLELLRLFRS